MDNKRIYDNYAFISYKREDEKWAEWALELEQLTQEYPHIAQNAFLAEGFKDFDHSTGYNLPLETPWAVQKAMELVEYYKKPGRKG